ncbi:MAG: carboxypeptidase regulatory-like domain-containing protein [Gemmatimonadota bacterium]
MIGALTHLVDDDHLAVRQSLTNERGQSLFVGIPEGSYHVRVEMIGMATIETEFFQISDGTSVTRVIRAAPRAIELEGLEVALASDRCTVRPSDGALVFQIWDEARKALAVISLTDERGRYRYETVRYEREIDRETSVVFKEERSRRGGFMETPYESRPAEDLTENGFVRKEGTRDLYLAPDASVLLSDTFLDTHCFHLADPSHAPPGLVGLGFRPTGENRSVPDIAGILWIDRETAELQWLEYTYAYLEPERTSPEVGGRVDFERMPDGTWIVREWWIRMPIMAVQPDFQGQPRRFIARYQQTGGLVVDIREAGGRSLGQHARTGGVEGVVLDSLGAPLQGVRVGIVGSSQQVFTTANGGFAIPGLPEGRYQVRFVAPAIEAAGYELEPVRRDVVPGEMAYLEYHVPSMTDMLFDECRDVARDEDVVVLAGTVVDRFGTPVPEATVRVQWHVYDFSGVRNNRRGTDLRQIPRVLEATTGPRGSYTFCTVPAKARLFLRAWVPGAQSEEIEFVILEHEIGAVRTLELSPSR